MDTNSKRRAAWRRDEMERRRTERGRQRSEMMSQRRNAAQTQYMDRMAGRAEKNGASASAVNAIRYGESIASNQDRRQMYMTADAQRKAALIAARSPEAVQKLKSSSDQYVADQRLAGETYSADRDFEGRKYIGDSELRSNIIRGEYGLKEAQLGYDSAAIAAAARQKRDQERMEFDANQAELDRENQLAVAGLEATGVYGEDAFAPQPIFDGDNMTGYMIYDDRAKKWNEKSFK